MGFAGRQSVDDVHVDRPALDRLDATLILAVLLCTRAAPAGGVEARDESGPPVAPGLRSGGGRVCLGQGAQQVEHHDRAAHGLAERGNGRRVLGVAAGRQLDEGQVLPHEAHDDLAVGVTDTHPAQDGVGELAPVTEWSVLRAPCRCRAARRRA